MSKIMRVLALLPLLRAGYWKCLRGLCGRAGACGWRLSVINV